MIDVGFQHNMSYAMPRRDPDTCIRDMCREPLAEGSTGFCEECWRYMRGDE